MHLNKIPGEEGGAYKFEDVAECGGSAPIRLQ